MNDLAETLRRHAAWLCAAPDGARASLRFADLRDADLRDADLRGSNLRDADLRGSDLSGSNLGGADLCDADLRGSNLGGANLRGSDLSGSDLRGANLRGSDLRGSNLRDADLRGADLRDADLRATMGLPVAADAPTRLQAVAATVLAQPAALQMSAWHSECGTAHCLAGWAIHQAGPVGSVLKRMHGLDLAGLLLLGPEAALHFYDSNEAALAWLRSIHTTTEQESTDGDA